MKLGVLAASTLIGAATLLSASAYAQRFMADGNASPFMAQGEIEPSRALTTVEGFSATGSAVRPDDAIPSSQAIAIERRRGTMQPLGAVPPGGWNPAPRSDSISLDSR
jgi:hypothetical protein